jgi:uncharacterized membrane protein
VSERGLARAILVLAVLGAGIAAYLTYVRYTGGTVACTTGGCELVQGSRYSAMAGIPVALIGLVGYLCIAASTLVRGEAGAAIGLGLTVVGFAFAMYLLYLQAFVIEAFCHRCLASDGVIPSCSCSACRDSRPLSGLSRVSETRGQSSLL